MYITCAYALGVRDTDDTHFPPSVCIQTSDTLAYCIVPDDAPVRESWTVITEAQYHAGVDPMLPYAVVTASVDKSTIQANGTDTATVTATVPATTGLTEINFMHSDTGTLISTQPVANGVATLGVTATTPGTINVQAGSGAGPGNEVSIVVTAS
jgi:hypothetical protein